MEGIMINKKQYGPTLYYFHDKAIYDGLSQHSISKPDLHRFLLKKGVLASQESDTGLLAYYLSSFTFDYFDRNHLSELLTTTPKRENVSSSTIKTEENPALSDEAIRQALTVLKGELATDPDCAANVVCSKDSFVLDITYKDHDLRKPEARQIETKKAQVEIIKDEIGYTIRSPANDFGSKIVEQLKDSLSKEVEGQLVVKELSLTSITDSLYVSKFFEILMNNVEGYNLKDVTNVKLFHPEDDEESEEIAASHIRKAMLNGEQVLISPELKSLFDRGFHISSVQWVSDEKLHAGDRVAFEASLKKPETKEGFSFQIRGIYRYSERTHDITQKLTTPSNIEKKAIHKKLEQASENALSEVNAMLED